MFVLWLEEFRILEKTIALSFGINFQEKNTVITYVPIIHMYRFTCGNGIVTLATVCVMIVCAPSVIMS